MGTLSWAAIDSDSHVQNEAVSSLASLARPPVFISTYSFEATSLCKKSSKMAEWLMNEYVINRLGRNLARTNVVDGGVLGRARALG